MRLLGGEIQLTSAPGKGSTFTVYLPLEARPAADTAKESAAGATPVPAAVPPAPPKPVEEVPDDRDALEEGDRVLLVVEDDPKFATVLRDQCHERQFRCVVAPTGEDGLALARRLLPAGIILDLRLPGMDGWAVLDALKGDPQTRHIPVHIISVEEAAAESLRRGAVGHITKPVSREDIHQAFLILDASSRPFKSVLVAEDDEVQRRGIVKLIQNGDVHVDEAATGREAFEAIASKPYDCIVLDLRLPDMDGLALLERLAREDGPRPPVVVYTAHDLTRDETTRLQKYTQSIVLKDARSEERLLEEVSLFLHRVVSDMPEGKRRVLAGPHGADPSIEGAKVLVVDDDSRTTFALSRLLADRGIRVLTAEDGEKALRVLHQEPDVELVLMDIMMPVMDGYETIGRIRAQDGFRKLPIIALTAKAMPEDREKCLAAGASDYLPKPLDEQRLLSMMRVWLYRRREVALSRN